MRRNVVGLLALWLLAAPKGTATAQEAERAEAATAAGHLGDKIAADTLAPAPLRLKVIPGFVNNAKRLGPNPDLSGLRRWDAFSGVVPIGEPQFYRILGQSELEHMAITARKRRRVAVVAGAASMVVGTLLFTSRPPLDRPAISAKHLVGGFMIPMGGLTIGVSMIVADRKRVPLGIAQELAEGYNMGRPAPAHADQD